MILSPNATANGNGKSERNNYGSTAATPKLNVTRRSSSNSDCGGNGNDEGDINETNDNEDILSFRSCLSSHCNIPQSSKYYESFLPIVSPNESMLVKDKRKGQAAKVNNYHQRADNRMAKTSHTDAVNNDSTTIAPSSSASASCSHMVDSTDRSDGPSLAPFFPLSLDDDINDLKKIHSKFITQILPHPLPPQQQQLSSLSPMSRVSVTMKTPLAPKIARKNTRKTLQPLVVQQLQPQKIPFNDDIEYHHHHTPNELLLPSVRTPFCSFSVKNIPSSSSSEPCGILMNSKSKTHENIKTPMTRDYSSENDQEEVMEAAMILCKIKTDELVEMEQWCMKVIQQQDMINNTCSNTPSSLLLKRKSDHCHDSFSKRSRSDFDMNVSSDDDTNDDTNDDDDEEEIMEEEHDDDIFDHITTTSTISHNEKKKNIKKTNKKTLPNRLALPQDQNEVNSLHCYVRSDLLELFVVPPNNNGGKNTSRATIEKAYLSRLSSTSSSLSSSERKTRSSTSTFEILNNTKKGVTSSQTTSSTNRRYIPGRVGLRCVHCKSHQMKKQSHSISVGKSAMLDASKPDFFPKSIRQLYREVCTWQRVHFQHCPYVPQECRDKYRHLKQSDKSRGKTRYWESSARDIGLINVLTANGEHDGICFSDAF